MHTYDPRDWQVWRGPQRDAPEDPSPGPLLRWDLIMAASLFIASHFPPELVPLVFGRTLLWGGLGMAVVAALRCEPLWAPHLTRWDVAAGCAAPGLLVLILFPAPPGVPAGP